MAKRQIEWGKRKRQELIRLLGGRCEKDGCSGSKLEIHHKDGREYDIRQLSSDQRVRMYLKEYKQGVRLGVLCKYHNTITGDPRKQQKQPAF